MNDALIALDFGALESAFEQMSSAQFSGLTDVQLLDAILVRSTYTRHLQEFCLNKERRCGEKASTWIGVLGQWQNQEKAFGYRDTTAGATIGADYAIQDWVLGVALSSMYDDFHAKSSPSKAHVNSYYGGLYSGWSQEGLYLNLSFVGGYNRYRTHRRLVFGGIDRRASGKHSGNNWLGHFGFGYQARPPRLHWTPYIDLDYVQQHEGGYTETGAGSLDLHVHTKNAGLFQGEAGVMLSVPCPAGSGLFTPMLTLAYMNQTPCYGSHYRANFAHAPCVFTSHGTTYERNLFAPRLDFTYHSSCNRISTSLYYNGEVAPDYWSQAGGLDLTFRF